VVFVQSRVKADNTVPKQHANGKTMDIYDAKSFEYIGSLYIANEDGAKVRKVMAIDEKMVAVFDSYVNIYETNFLLQ